MKSALIISLAMSCVAFTGAASAQNTSSDHYAPATLAPATLELHDGSAMVSTGDEYISAKDGQKISAGDQLMVSDGATAVVVFGGNSQECRQEFRGPNVYVVPGNCTTAAPTHNQNGRSVAIIAGAAAIAAATLASMNNAAPAAISAGAR
jgi:hypothetical protein